VEGVTLTAAGVASTLIIVAPITGTISENAIETLTPRAGSNATVTIGATDIAGDDVINGGACADEIDPGAGADSIATGSGSDDILIDLVVESAASGAADSKNFR